MASALLKEIHKESWRIISDYVKHSYQNDPIRVVIEGFLLAFAIWYIGTRAYRPNTAPFKLSPREIDELCEEWSPEPLVNPGCEFAEESVRNGAARMASSNDFLGIREEEDIKKIACETVRVYGVGTCGPAGFYGTLDIHQKLQNQLAEAFEVESALVLAQGYSAVAGVIPAFCKRNDVIIVDEGASFAIQRGVLLSRSHVHQYRHNDMEHLEQLMLKVEKEHSRKRAPLTRRFIVTEGLFANHGDTSPLPEIVKLANSHKWRLILDESLSFGVLGKSGRGSAEHWNISRSDRSNIIFVGALSNSLGSAGGFTAGNKQAIEHQVLSNQAYCYSASLPAIFAAAALEAMRLVPSIIDELNSKIAEFDRLYTKYSAVFSIRGLIIEGERISPVRFLRYTAPTLKLEIEQDSLKKIASNLLKNRNWLIAFRRVAQSDEQQEIRPALRVCVCRSMDIDDFFKALVEALPSEME